MQVIIWKKMAVDDLVKIGRYIAEDSPATAKRLLDLIKDHVQSLAAYPNLGRPGRKNGTLELVVHKHYVVVYRTVASRVDILRVRHTARQWPPSRSSAGRSPRP